MRIVLAILLFICKVSATHHDFSERELQHVFGTRSKRSVPEYSLETPLRRKENGADILTVTVNGRREEFVIVSHGEKLFSDGFHMIVRDGLNSSMSTTHPEENCVFRGYSRSSNGTRVALVGCDENFRGLIVTSNNEHYLLQRHPRRPEHIVHKRNVRHHEDSSSCLFDPLLDPFPEDRMARDVFGGHSPRLAVIKAEELTIELAVFADDAMWRHFIKLYGPHADAEMHRFITAVVNNIDVLFARRSLQPRVNVKIVRYEVMKNPPDILSKRAHRLGDVDRLLEAFCGYQHAINPADDRDPRHWDHALLFSGYDLYREGLRTVAGYAPVKGMCSGQRSCTLNEGLDFGSVFVVTHEMGHSLGMYHDGDNECDLRCCVMSPSVGAGKTEWSQCSNKEFNVFLSRLGTRGRPENCLSDNAAAGTMIRERRDAPGQQFTLDEQCSIFHGECWKHELRDGQLLQDVCEMVWCGNGEGIIRTAHPALEGSYCGNGKWCFRGRCVPQVSIPPPINGRWSPWNDDPHRSCAPGCSACEIEGQLRLRRSIRTCSQPSTNNGGRRCTGDEARGLVCQAQRCRGKTVINFASSVCAALRDDPNTPNPQLSGEGLQFPQAKCKIWCQMAHSNQIRTVSNFPDGTPCGDSQYCIKGECRSLLCNGQAVVASDQDCPGGWRALAQHDSTNRVVPQPGFSLTKKRQNTFLIPNNMQVKKSPPLAKAPGDEQKRRIRQQFFVDRESDSIPTSPNIAGDGQSIKGIGRWTEWSEWSACYGVRCGSNGIQIRSRKCSSGSCPGARRQKKPCKFFCWNESFRLPGIRDGEQTTRLQFSSTRTSVSPIPESSTDPSRSTTEVASTEAPSSAQKTVEEVTPTSRAAHRKRYIEQSSYEKGPDSMYRDLTDAVETTGYQLDELDATVDVNSPLTSEIPHMKSVATVEPPPRAVPPRFRPSRTYSQQALQTQSTHQRLPYQQNRNVASSVPSVEQTGVRSSVSGWTAWTEWSQCSYPCTSGFRIRRRTCYGEDQVQCVGEADQRSVCRPEICYRQHRLPSDYSQQYYNQQPQQNYVNNPVYYQSQAAYYANNALMNG